MAASKQDKIKASTQEHLDIDDITDDLVILKNGWVALVLSTTAVNFDILSEAEQDATIYAYGALLNSLTFPVQVLIRSKKADITAYYQHLIEAENSQSNPDLKVQIRKYREFVQSTVQQKTILDKRFYLVIHFTPLELGVKSFKKTDTANKKSKAQLIIDAKNSLHPKRDHLIKQTARLGLFTKQLETQELIELFYDIYNPAPTGTQRVILNASSYTTPLVEPDLESPTPAPAVSQKESSEDLKAPMGDSGNVVPAVNENNVTVNDQTLIQPAVVANQSVVSQPIVMPSSEQTITLPPQQGTQAVPNAQTVPAGQQEALKSLQDAINRASSMATGSGAPTSTTNMPIGGKQ